MFRNFHNKRDYYTNLAMVSTCFLIYICLQFSRCDLFLLLLIIFEHNRLCSLSNSYCLPLCVAKQRKFPQKKENLRENVVVKSLAIFYAIQKLAAILALCSQPMMMKIKQNAELIFIRCALCRVSSLECCCVSALSPFLRVPSACFFLLLLVFFCPGPSSVRN